MRVLLIKIALFYILTNRPPLKIQANRQIANIYPPNKPTATLFGAYMVRILILIRPVMTFAYASSLVVILAIGCTHKKKYHQAVIIDSFEQLRRVLLRIVKVWAEMG